MKKKKIIYEKNPNPEFLCCFFSEIQLKHSQKPNTTILKSTHTNTSTFSKKKNTTETPKTAPPQRSPSQVVFVDFFF